MKEKLDQTKPIPMTESMVSNIYKQIDRSNERGLSFAEMTRRLITEALNNREVKKEVKQNV